VKPEDITCALVTVILGVCNLVRHLVPALKSVARKRMAKANENRLRRL
jgi:hypothetical protein